MLYRKKPVVIEAIQYTDLLSVDAIIEMAGRGEGLNNSPDGLYIRTLGGTVLASKGDYVIRGLKGELYPCKPDIFEETHEEVQENA